MDCCCFAVLFVDMGAVNEEVRVCDVDHDLKLVTVPADKCCIRCPVFALCSSRLILICKRGFD